MAGRLSCLARGDFGLEEDSLRRRMSKRSCRPSNAARVVYLHLVVFGCLLRVAVLFVVGLVVSVSQAFGFAAALGKVVLEGSAEQVSALGRYVFEDFFWWRFALVFCGDLVCPVL